MDWRAEFLEHCKRSREMSLEMAEWLESGRAKFTHNDVDVTADAAARHRRNAEEMDRLIPKIESDLRNA